MTRARARAYAGRVMLAFLISALTAGFVVVFVLPFISEQIAKVPGLADLTRNRIVQLIVVGAVLILALGLFNMLARRIKV